MGYNNLGKCDLYSLFIRKKAFLQSDRLSRTCKHGRKVIFFSVLNIFLPIDFGEPSIFIRQEIYSLDGSTQIEPKCAWNLQIYIRKLSKRRKIVFLTERIWVLRDPLREKVTTNYFRIYNLTPVTLSLSFWKRQGIIILLSRENQFKSILDIFRAFPVLGQQLFSSSWQKGANFIGKWSNIDIFNPGRFDLCTNTTCDWLIAPIALRIVAFTNLDVDSSDGSSRSINSQCHKATLIISSCSMRSGISSLLIIIAHSSVLGCDCASIFSPSPPQFTRLINNMLFVNLLCFVNLWWCYRQSKV